MSAPVLTTYDFNDSGLWTNLSSDQTTLSLNGVSVHSTGGVLTQFKGLAVDSPSDSMTEGWTKEIDAWNDTPEVVTLTFDQPQTNITVTLNQLYQEWIWIVEPEKVNYKVHLADGSVVNGVALATATTKPGALNVTVDDTMTGGKAIVSIEVSPSLDLPQVPAPNVRPNTPNMQRPFSEFTVAAVTFTTQNHDVAVGAAENGDVTETVGTPAPGALLTDTGTIKFTDSDLSDSHVASVTPVGAPQGVLTAQVTTDTTGGGEGQVTWSYQLDAGQAESLAAGETRIESFNVLIDDGKGGQATQQIDVTITGTNDVPTIDVPATTATGAVTERAGLQGSALLDTASGTVAFKDVDLSDTHTISITPVGANLGTLTASPVSEAAGAGSVGWSYQVVDGAIDYLGAGETKVESFNVTVDDGHGGTATQQVDVTITGVNDGPTIDNAGTNGSGAVNERTNLTGSALADTASGVVAFKDIDLSDSHSVTATPIGSTLGTLTLGAVSESGGSGNVGWTYTVTDSAIDYLAAGQTRVESFNVVVDDGHGGTATKQIDVTITGANDAPTINAALTTATGAVTERAGLTGSPLLDTTSGSVAFKDVDLTDTHTVSFTPVGTTLGALSLTPVSEASGAGSVGWAYKVVDSAIDYLGAGETKVESFNVTVDDGHGGTATQQIDVTLTGVNDGPTISATGTTTTGAVTERANLTGSSLADTATGTIAFKDIDVSDTHTVTATSIGTTYGALTFGTVTEANGSGSVGWTYKVTDSAIDFLAAGQTRVESFNVVVDDGHGGTATKQVNVTITGTNDKPTIDAALTTATGTVTERAGLNNSSLTDTTSGQIAFKDVDLTDTHTMSVTPVGTTLGTLTLGVVTEGPGAGKAAWTYNVTDKKLDYLAAGQTKVENFTVTVNDGHGGTTTQTVAITLVGTNDGPRACDDAVCVNANDSTSNLWSLALSNDTDPDQGTVKTITSVNTSGTQGIVLFNAASHSLVYIADTDAYGALSRTSQATDRFDYTLSDGQGGTDVGTVVVTIKGVANTETGGSGCDWISLCGSGVVDGKGGDDRINGSNSDDVLKGGDGDDILYGNYGDDVLYGNKGNDSLFGGFGDDILLGGAGNNTLSGGSGRDLFVFSTLTQKDVVSDFQLGTDHIYLENGITVTNVQEIGTSVKSTVLTLSTGASVTLLGLSGLNHDASALYA